MTDMQRSVLRTTDSQSAYTPYGHRAVEGECPSLLGFNGERPDSLTEHYILGMGTEPSIRYSCTSTVPTD